MGNSCTDRTPRRHLAQSRPGSRPGSRSTHEGAPLPLCSCLLRPPPSPLTGMRNSQLPVHQAPSEEPGPTQVGPLHQDSCPLCLGHSFPRSSWFIPYQGGFAPMSPPRLYHCILLPCPTPSPCTLPGSLFSSHGALIFQHTIYRLTIFILSLSPL